MERERHGIKVFVQLMDDSMDDSFIQFIQFIHSIHSFIQFIHSKPDHSTYRQLIPVALLRIQPKAFSRLRSPGSSRQQRLNSRLRIEELLLAEPRVHHINDPVDRHRRLRDVRARHHFPHPLRRLLERRLLLRGRQGREQRDDEQGSLVDGPRGHGAAELCAEVENFLLAGEEEQNVARRLV